MQTQEGSVAKSPTQRLAFGEGTKDVCETVVFRRQGAEQTRRRVAHGLFPSSVFLAFDIDYPLRMSAGRQREPRASLLLDSGGCACERLAYT
jgi:hypothetical protein